MSNSTQARLPTSIQNTQSNTKSSRLEASHSFEINGPIDQVFALFDPVSEREWVDDWNPLPIIPEELSREAGTVFTLERDDRMAVWTILRYSAVQHLAEYLVTEYDYQHRWIYVSCSAETEHTTRVMVRYVTTALTPLGQQELNRYGPEFLRAWEEPVQMAINQSGA